MSDACQELQESAPDPGLVRLSLLSSLDASLREVCNGTRHAPTLWLAGDAKLKFGERWLDIGATGDCMGLTASALYRLTEINTGATHYRLIENRISFERVSRLLNTSRDEPAIGLPGYAPNWWRTAISQLLALWPAPSRISCDADPDGEMISGVLEAGG